MIDIVELKGKKVIFVDETSFGYPLDLERDNTPAALRYGTFVKASSLFKKEGDKEK